MDGRQSVCGFRPIKPAHAQQFMARCPRCHKRIQELMQ